MPISGDLRLGGRYQFHGNASGQITACEPPRSLALTWEFGGQVSWVAVELSKLSDGGTRLRLEHIAHIPDDLWNQYGPGAMGIGWDMAFMGLGLHLATGNTVDPKQAAAWQASAAGKDFARASSEEWCRASISAGTEKAAAQASAARVTAFYTGDSPK